MERDGIVIMDKPKGLTSREACQQLKRMLGASKAGNSGTLDPNSTGVLLICIGNATKLMPALQGMDKEYEATIQFHKDMSKEAVAEIAKKFVGEITQVPPVKSAVARKPRQKIIYSIHVERKEGKNFILKIKCQSGTYIRKLASDMGELCGGANLTELRRTAVGEFKESQAQEMEELGDEVKILPLEIGVKHIKKMVIKDSAIPFALEGKPIHSSHVLSFDKKMVSGELIAIMSGKGEVIALAKFGSKPIMAYIDRVIRAPKR